MKVRMFSIVTARCLGLTLAAAALAAALSCRSAPETPAHRTFARPEDAVRALADAAKSGTTDDLLAIFGPDAKDLVASSDAVARRNRQVFTAAVAEQWRLEDAGPDSKTLVIGNETWPFPIPLARVPAGWQFDTAAGKEEVLSRRIGRNELAVMRICLTYVAAQRLYAKRGHDGHRAGVYATTFRSDPGRQNGLYWPLRRGEKRSPLGDLVAHAAEQGGSPDQAGQPPAPFHGYYFKILTAQGPAAAGGAKDYIVKGEMSAGFALVAWPAEYDVTGIMTFVVNEHGIIHQKDLGPETGSTARAMTVYNPDASWAAAQ